MAAGQLSVRKIAALSDLVAADFDAIAIDIPIGLLDVYEPGGRACDRAARKVLGRLRASSVFPPPVRSVLAAESWEDACLISRANGGKAMSKQTFGIMPKIREADALLASRPNLRKIIREVHPELSFCEMAGAPMRHRKTWADGREERRRALAVFFSRLSEVEQSGRKQGLPIEDILDAAAACWSAARIANGRARSLPADVPVDARGIAMAIWT
jgi:predicted RNase H-like nuclease